MNRTVMIMNTIIATKKKDSHEYPIQGVAFLYMATEGFLVKSSTTNLRVEIVVSTWGALPVDSLNREDREEA